MGKKMAVLVGCNYASNPNITTLRGCQNDVLAMRLALTSPRFGFEAKHINLLTDKPGSPIMPTGGNIKRALNRMIDMARKGDVLFFHFSGHGGPYTYRGREVSAIVPSDNNLINSVDFRQMVGRVPKGATFTILSDSCHSGELIDKEKEQIGPAAGRGGGSSSYAVTNINDDEDDDDLMKPRMIPFESLLEHFTNITGKTDTEVDFGALLVEVFGEDASILFRDPASANSIRRLRPDEGILLSGCQKLENSWEADGMNAGAFSNAVQKIFKKNPAGRALTNKDIVLQARKILIKNSNKHIQHPCLYCSDANANAVFLGTPPTPRSINDDDDEDHE